jgi:phage terminase large subunit
MADLSAVPDAVRAEMQHWYDDPIYFARKELKMEPDPAQVDLLTAFADPSIQRIAIKSNKGPGKTAGLAVCAWNFLATRKHPRMAACSISKDNLMDNLWPELAKWQRHSKYLSTKFKWTKSRIFSIDHPETWWLSARSWSQTAEKEQQSLTMAGLHSDNTLALFDESGGIPDGVMATGDATLATIGGEHRIIQTGNPTHVEGPLYRACTTERQLWHLIEITGDPDDPKRSPRISIQWAREQIEKYGKDNPWVLVNVFGQFPPGSITSLLGPDEVSTAMQRHLQTTMYSHEAKILGVDPGRFGGARSVIFPRQGLAAHAPVVLRPNRTQKDWTGAFAGRIGQAFEKWGADVCFIDDTGGWGAGILDTLVAGGYNAIGVGFAANALDRRYQNRRAEMHFAAADWVKKGGALPFLPELQREATATNYWFRKTFQIEEKEQVKEKIGESPDLWDAFVLTFAQPVAPRTGLDWIDRKTLHAHTDPEEHGYHRRQRALVVEED